MPTNIVITEHVVQELPSERPLIRGEKYKVMQPDGTLIEYVINSQGEPVRLKGITNDESSRLNRLSSDQISKVESITTGDISKLKEDYTKEQIDTKISDLGNLASSSKVSLGNSTVLPVPPQSGGVTIPNAWVELAQNVTYTQAGGSPITGIDGHRSIAEWNGTSWSLVDMGELPQVEGTDTLEEEEIPKGKAVAEYVDNKVKPIDENFILSKNIIDKTKIVAGQFDYASGTSGGINVTNNWIRTEQIYLPDYGINDGDWVTVQGHQIRSDTQSPVILYSNAEMSGVRQRKYGDGVNTYTTFQVQAPYLYMGINVANGTDIGLNPSESPFYSSIMASKGQNVLPYEDFGYYLDPDKYPTKKDVEENTISIEKSKLNLDLILERYDKNYKFNGVSSYVDLPTTHILSEAGDYVEFRGKWNGSTFTNGLGLLGVKSMNNDHTLGFYSSNQLWLRTAPSSAYVQFNGIPNVSSEVKTYRLVFTGSAYELYIDDILIDTQASTDATPFNINNIGQSYQNNYFSGDLHYVNIRSGGVLTVYDQLGLMTTSVNIDTELTPKGVVDSEALPNVFYSFDPTGFNDKGLFIVYTRRGDTDFFIGHHVANDYDMSESAYKDIYRIVYAHEYRYVDGEMVLQSNYTIYEGESECVFMMGGGTRVDHTGGIHGDETMQIVKFFANGVELATSAPISLKPCIDFFYVQKSTMHYTPLTSEPYGNHEDICTHYKKTMFNGKGYVTENKLIGLLEDGLPFAHWYHGICCAGKIQASVAMNINLETADMTGSNTSQMLVVDGSKDITMWHSLNSKAIFISSEITNNDVIDKSSYVFVWDRLNDSKYYRKTPVFTLGINEEVSSVMSVNYK